MDKDLRALQEVRELVEKAHGAQKKLLNLNQHRIDKIVETMCQRGARYARELAELAVSETKMGRLESKVVKNWFNTEYLWDYLKDVKTVGVINRDEEKKVLEIAVPKGVVAGIIPTTNPTSTALFKSIIAIKSRNTIVLSPHPRAIKCINRSAEIMHRAAVDAGAPEGCIGCMSTPTLDATHALMEHKKTSVILATGGSGLVKAAYSSGKPALGVGPGNAPAYIHRSADIKHAVSAIIMSQTFDWGTICSTEQSIVVDLPKVKPVLRELARQKAHICNEEEVALLEKGIVGAAGHGLNVDIIGQSPARIAQICGFSIPEDSTALIAPYQGIGKDYPLSMEKLSPILSFYTADNFEEGLDKCNRILNYGGTGHSLAIHATDEEIILRMAERLPAYRIVINSPTVQGSIGYSTNLVPSMTLGCGAPGNNIISNNVNALDLIDIKRVAWVKEGFVKPIVDDDRASFPASSSSSGDLYEGYAPERDSHQKASPSPGYSSSQPSRSSQPSSPSPSRGMESQAPLTENEIEEILRKANVSRNNGGY